MAKARRRVDRFLAATHEYRGRLTPPPGEESGYAASDDEDAMLGQHGALWAADAQARHAAEGAEPEPVLLRSRPWRDEPPPGAPPPLGVRALLPLLAMVYSLVGHAAPTIRFIRSPLVGKDQAVAFGTLYYRSWISTTRTVLGFETTRSNLEPQV